MAGADREVADFAVSHHAFGQTDGKLVRLDLGPLRAVRVRAEAVHHGRCGQVDGVAGVAGTDAWQSWQMRSQRGKENQNQMKNTQRFSMFAVKE